MSLYKKVYIWASAVSFALSFVFVPIAIITHNRVTWWIATVAVPAMVLFYLIGLFYVVYKFTKEKYGDR